MGILCCHTAESEREVVTGAAQGPPRRYMHEVSGKKLAASAKYFMLEVKIRCKLANRFNVTLTDGFQ
jgi:hypothetical protein